MPLIGHMLRKQNAIENDTLDWNLQGRRKRDTSKRSWRRDYKNEQHLKRSNEYAEYDKSPMVMAYVPIVTKGTTTTTSMHYEGKVKSSRPSLRETRDKWPLDRSHGLRPKSFTLV